MDHCSFCNAQVSVVLALALPFLSLAFGYIPAKQDLDTAADMVQANVEDLNGWEISSLLWAAARLGYRPADHVMQALLQQVLLPLSLLCLCELNDLQLHHANQESNRGAASQYDATGLTPIRRCPSAKNSCTMSSLKFFCLAVGLCCPHLWLKMQGD